jgi:hypothetical protein
VDTEDFEKSKTKRVGYCNPPEHSRFQKGKSGNPTGRPKGTLNVATVLARTLQQKVVVKENGKRRTVTKLEAALLRLTNKAAAGDLRAVQLLAALARSAEERGVPEATPNESLGEPEEDVFTEIVRRIKAAGKGESDEIVKK